MPGIPFFIFDDLIEMDCIRAVFIFRAFRFRGEKAAMVCFTNIFPFMDTLLLSSSLSVSL